MRDNHLTTADNRKLVKKVRQWHVKNEKTPEKPGFSEESLVFSGIGEHPRQDSNLQPTD